MKRFLILIIAYIVLFSGCVSQKTVKTGDNISVDFTGSLPDGQVFDTSIEKVARENNIFTPGREYRPLNFTVGKEEVIKGFDEEVIGMIIGESKTIIIPPEKAYGPIDPEAINIIPIMQTVPAASTLPKIFDMPLPQFQQTFGIDKAGGIIRIPGTNINLTILNINSTSVSLAHKLKVGDLITSAGAPWDQTVIKIDDKNITVKNNAKKNDSIEVFPGAPWSTTVVDVNNLNITIRHNAVPDTEIPYMYGTTRIHFNETSIILDRNPKFAGKTLIFNIILRSIE